MRTPDLAAILAASVVVAFAAPAAAQYKWVGAGGQVHYSDQPPPAGVSGVLLDTRATSPRDEPQAPVALRNAATKHPVVLYTTADCAPCQQARSHLAKRGIPFAERTVKSAGDADAFRRAGFGDNSFPSVSVGRERSVGYESADWDRLLDAAGYPKTSMLPPSYKQPPARGLAAADAARRATGANDAGGVVEDAPNATEATAVAEPRETPPVRQRGPAPRAVAESTPLPAPRTAASMRF